MKHSFIIIATLFAIMAVDAKAQGLVYTPFNPKQSSSSYDVGRANGGYSSSRSRSGYARPSQHTQTIRTTAYFVGYNGDYYKVPICVEYTVYSNGATSLSVTEQYESNGFGGQWKRLLSPARVTSCQSITANGDTAELERSFMYKAMVGTKWYYFDL